MNGVRGFLNVCEMYVERLVPFSALFYYILYIKIWAVLPSLSKDAFLGMRPAASGVLDWDLAHYLLGTGGSVSSCQLMPILNSSFFEYLHFNPIVPLIWYLFSFPDWCLNRELSIDHAYSGFILNNSVIIFIWSVPIFKNAFSQDGLVYCRRVYLLMYAVCHC